MSKELKQPSIKFQADKTFENICINLEFMRSPSLSKQEKVKEFWKCLDSQNILKIYSPQCPHRSEKDNKLDDSICSTCCSCSSASTIPSVRSWPNEPKKEEKPKKCRKPLLDKIEKYLREDLKFADSVEVPYEELKAEIEAYQKRLLRCGCKEEKCECRKEKL